MSDRAINLNKARKSRDRASKKARGDANAVKFGRSKAEKTQDKETARAQVRHLDGHKRGT